jgi:hypothetical protein
VTDNGQPETGGNLGAEKDAVISLRNIIVALNKMPEMSEIPVGPVKGTLQHRDYRERYALQCAVRKLTRLYQSAAASCDAVSQTEMSPRN